MAKSTKPTNQAVHRHVADTIVTYKKVTSPFGESQVQIRFKNGERTSMSEKRFDETFRVL
jgi:hypothetical protein